MEFSGLLKNHAGGGRETGNQVGVALQLIAQVILRVASLSPIYLDGYMGYEKQSIT